MGEAEGESSAWPHGERRDRSRSETEAKQVGIRWRSRALPRSVSEVRVALSTLRNLRQTRDTEFRLRVSEINPMMVERIASGRSLIGALLMATAVIRKF